MVLLAVGRDFPVRDLGLEHYGVAGSGPDAYRRDGSPPARRRPVGRRRPGGARAAHAPGATTRASSSSGWRWARRSSRTTARSRGRPTWTPRRRPSGCRSTRRARPASTRSSASPTSRRRAKGYSVEAETGHVTIVVDRATAHAGRGGDGLPGRVGGDPRVRRRDQGAGPRRRPRRDDPRVPVDVADLQRPVRGGEAQARRGSRASGPGDDDLAVDQHEPRARVPQRAADLDRLARPPPPAGREVRPAARHEPPAVALARRSAAASRQAARIARHSDSAFAGPNGERALWPVGRRASDGACDPRPRVHGLDRRVRAERDHGARRRRARRGRSRAPPRAAPHRRRAFSASERTWIGLHRSSDPQRREARDVRLGDELRVLDTRHRAASPRRSAPGRRGRPEPPRRRCRGSGSRSRATPPARPARRAPRAGPARRRSRRSTGGGSPGIRSSGSRRRAVRRAQRAVGEGLEPAHAGAGRAGPGQAARRSGAPPPRAAPSCSGRMHACTRTPSSPAAASRRYASIGPPRSERSPRPPGSWTATTPRASELGDQRPERVRDLVAGRQRAAADEACGRLVEHAGRAPGVVAPDDPAIRVGGGVVDAGLPRAHVG